MSAASGPPPGLPPQAGGGGFSGDPLEYRERWRVRSYELDSNGHVNNSVYLSWAEEIATRHAETAGYGKEWSIAKGGAWVIHRSECTYRRPAVYNDEVEVHVRVELLRGPRGVRRTWIRRTSDGEVLAEILTEWAWIRLSDGRPSRIPPELEELGARISTPSPFRSRPAR